MKGVIKLLELKNIRKSYGNVTPLKDASVVINKGDVISVIGPSGTGKSTLLRCINMLEQPDSGDLILNGQKVNQKGYDIDRMRMKVGMIFQSFNLFDHLTVIENIMHPQIKLLGVSRQQAYDRGIELLESVGLAEKQFSYPDELSGGQKQRVAIVRTLAMQPDIILFDEPTSALDPTMVSEVQTVIRDLAESGRTMMIVTHDMEFASGICNRVFYMDEGGIYEDGTPEQIFFAPKREKTRQFINRLSVLDIEISSKAFDFPKAISDIHQFGLRHRLYPYISKMQMAFEELCVACLLNRADSDVCIDAQFEYSKKNNTLLLAVRHNQAELTEGDFDNDLSLTLLKHVSKNIISSSICDQDSSYRGIITVEFDIGGNYEN